MLRKFSGALSGTISVLLAAVLAAPQAGSAREHPPEIKHSYDFKGDDMQGFGAEVNADMSRLGRLFGMPAASGVASAPMTEEEQKGWLGILMKLPQQKDGEQKREAIEVSRIMPNSAAEAAELQEGDLITGIDDTAIEGNENNRLLAFRTAVNKRHPGERVKLRFLRNGAPMEREAVLVSQPRTRAILKPHPEFEANHATTTRSLLTAALEKENLTPEFERLLREFRDEADKVASPLLRKQDYNPFRLQEVNYVMHYPLELPSVARRISDRLQGAFDTGHHDLAGLLHAAMEELDMPPAAGSAAQAEPPHDFSAYLERMVHALHHAQEERAAVLSALPPEDVDFLYAYAPQWLAEPPPAQDGGPPAGKKKEPDEAERRADEDKRLRLLRIALRLDLPRLLRACAEVARALDPDALRALSASARLEHYPANWKIREEYNLTVIDTPAGRVLIGGKGDNTYTEDAALIIDLGGNDRYLNHAGGSTRRDPFPVVIDLSGDDLYDAPGDFAQGAGFLGGGFLLDLAGDDRYTARNYAQGMGFLGAGVLADLSGRDRYAATAAAQGAGAFGVGMLAEGGGNDAYSGSRFVQGFGQVQGFGAIVEAAGNDHYFAGGLYEDFRAPGKAYQSMAQGFGYGMRPFESLVGASGGIGVIAEADGNDTYVADYFAQGASYWFALGILDDRKGNDRYISGRYSQGAGIHSSAGILVDDAGDDNYFADYGVAQGCGHDYGTGFLLDNGGNDRYLAGVTAQGAGNDNGLGVLSDNGGDDLYQTMNPGQGRGNYETARETGSFGFLFDIGGGSDSYSLGGRNDSLNYKEQWGILLDKN